MSRGTTSEMIGRAAYFTFRKAAKMPFVIGHVLQGDAARTVQKGSVFDRVEGEVGEEAFQELCQDDALVLETIFYCQEELGSLGKSLQASRKLLNSNFDENEQKKGLINHDFLVLKLQPGNPNEPALYIKAEKTAGDDDNELKPGIHITAHEGLDEQDLRRRCCLYKVRCGRMGLGDIFAVLKKESPSYDAQDENCWDYARRTTKRLLELACQKAQLASGGSGDEEYRRLRWELEHLEGNLSMKHVANTVERVARFAKTHVLDRLRS